MSSILFLIPNVSDILAFCSRKWYRRTPKFSVEYYLSKKFSLNFLASQILIGEIAICSRLFEILWNLRLNCVNCKIQ